MNKKLIINDLLLILILLVSLTLLSFVIYKPSNSQIVTVMYNNSYYKEYYINDNLTEEISNTGVIIEIKNGCVYIISSDCPDSTCMNSKPITNESAGGACIVCLPNKVSVIKNNSDIIREADAIAG